MDQGVIYIITNKINKKQYIGQTVEFLSSGRKYGLKQRWNKHLYDANNSIDDCKAFYNAIRKYGKDNFIIEELIKCNTKFLDIYEIKFINLFNTICPNGYNIESGGKKNKIMHQSTKEKLSKSHRFTNISELDKNNIVDAMLNLDINEIPFGINYTHHKNNNYEGFTVKKLDGKLKSIISDSKNLTEKLELALRYNSYVINNDVKNIYKIENELDYISKLTLRNKRLSEESKKYIFLAGYSLNDIPLNIRYEKRKNRFYAVLNDTKKYFKINDPLNSLKESIKFLQKRESV